jgi:ATP-binding cassette subfamily B protein
VIQIKDIFAKKTLGALAKLHPLFWKYRYRLTAGVFFVAVSNIFAIIPARYTRETIDLLKKTIPAENISSGNSVSEHFSDQLLIFLSFIIGSTLLRGIFMFFMRQGIIVVSRHMEYDLKNQIFRHYLLQDIGFFKTNQTGDLMARISEDVSQVRMYMGPALMYSVNLVVLFIITLWVMFSIHASLTWIILIPLPLLALSIFRVSQNIHKKSLEAQKAVSEVSSLAQSVFSGIRIIRSFHASWLFTRLMEKQSERGMKAQLAIYSTESLFSPLVGLLIGLSNLLVIFAGSYYHLKGEISLGSIAEFVIYVNMLTWPVTSIGWVSSLVRKASASQLRINAFLDQKSKLIQGNKPIPSVGDISFNQVSFCYPETGITALKDFNLSIEKGKKIGITGKTGSGKSTVLALLLRQYDPDSGSITYGGTDIREYNLQQWRQMLSVVFQDVFLFSDTLSRNITRENLQQEAWDKLFKKSALLSTVEELNQGRETMVGERGIMLSGGQKQRVSIARALQKQARILILDDCFSAVDLLTEKEILRETEQLPFQTSILISHRPTTLMKCDKIYYLEDGSVLACGSHEELSSKLAAYKTLASGMNN